MPFGISNAPAIFQKVSDQINSGIPFTAAYHDDIIISGKDRNDHINNLLAVLARISDFKFNKLQKCEFFKSEINYLDYRISKEGKKQTLIVLKLYRKSKLQLL